MAISVLSLFIEVARCAVQRIARWFREEGSLMAMYYNYDDVLFERSTFVRDHERVIVDRVATLAVEITFDDAAPQIMRFSDPVRARFFLHDLECEFARGGWTLAACELADRAGRRAEFALQPRA